MCVRVSCTELETQEAVREWREALALEKRRHRVQRSREAERYSAAVREVVRGRVGAEGLPPLCSCGGEGEGPWDTDPDTCANNCPFYRNHSGEPSHGMHSYT